MKEKTLNNIYNATRLGISASLLSFYATENLYTFIPISCFLTASIVEDINKDKFYNNTEDYKIIKPLYDEIIERTVQLMKTIELNNPIQIYQIYYYLYKNGYFSINKQFNLNNKYNFYDNKNYMGLDVINGRAVCRHLATMLSELENAYGYNSETHLVKIAKSKLTVLHLITNVKDDNYKYLFDPTHNLCLYGNSKLYNVKNDKYFAMSLKPSDYVFSKCKAEDTLIQTLKYNYLVNCQLADLKWHLSQKEINNFYNNNIDLYTEILDKARILQKNK